MAKQCDNCKHSEATLLDLVCSNDKSEYSGEFVRNDFVCKCWEKNIKESD